MTIQKENVQYYWEESESGFKAKIYISEHSDEVLAKVRWKENEAQRQTIIPVHPITSCREMAQRAIDIVKDRINSAQRKEIIKK
jgi:hypothetical protein